jgi:hypothetical protein
MPEARQPGMPRIPLEWQASKAAPLREKAGVAAKIFLVQPQQAEGDLLQAARQFA